MREQQTEIYINLHASDHQTGFETLRNTATYWTSSGITLLFTTGFWMFFAKTARCFSLMNKRINKSLVATVRGNKHDKSHKLPYLVCWKKMDWCVFSRHSLSKLERNIHKDKWWINKNFNPFTHKKRKHKSLLFVHSSTGLLSKGWQICFVKLFKQWTVNKVLKAFMFLLQLLHSGAVTPWNHA